ncbi:hypothetical protein ENSA7_64430 [Enhygromyxa salina]|uniref:Uncharacterized protein n=1 Tax=Enhygromyxa salina TaxID=215803 RepID=A0A2S9Y1B9_9BACT|nr:hypothetical protein ENSA7_64430 [Enhygromyxa salina]
MNVSDEDFEKLVDYATGAVNSATSAEYNRNRPIPAWSTP